MTYLFYGVVGVIILYAIVLHEVAHGWVAWKCGDDTAKKMGRITLDPTAHIDPIGTIFVPALLYFSAGWVFGWAKPVPVNPLRYKKMRRDDILVSMAGIVVNLTLALFMALLLAIPLLVPDVGGRLEPGVFGIGLPISGSVMLAPTNLAARALFYGVLINCGLAVFNLIPIPPLDGSHVLKQLLPRKLSKEYERIGFAGIIVLVLMLHVLNRQGIYPISLGLKYSAGYMLELSLFLRGLFGG